jgi:hypothetical protein
MNRALADAVGFVNGFLAIIIVIVRGPPLDFADRTCGATNAHGASLVSEG